MRWFPVSLITNSVLNVTHGAIELTIPVLWVCMLNHYATAPLKMHQVWPKGQEACGSPTLLNRHHIVLHNSWWSSLNFDLYLLPSSYLAGIFHRSWFHCSQQWPSFCHQGKVLNQIITLSRTHCLRLLALKKRYVQASSYALKIFYIAMLIFCPQLCPYKFKGLGGN